MLGVLVFHEETKMSDPVLTARSKLGAAARFGTAHDVESARRELNAALIERSIRAAIAATPPLTVEHRRHLAALLLDGGAA